MKKGQIIAINQNLFEYGGVEPCEYSKGCLHKVYEIDVDEDGVLTATSRTDFYVDKDLKNNEVKFTKLQWYGVIELLVRQNYDLTDEEVENLVKQVIEEDFVNGEPHTIEEAENCISTRVNKESEV